MSHIVAIFRHADPIGPLVMFSDGRAVGFDDDEPEARACLARRGQHVDRLPEVGECILVALPEEPPAIDWWVWEGAHRDLFRAHNRADAQAASLRDAGATGRIGHIWREDGQLRETWERVK